MRGSLVLNQLCYCLLVGTTSCFLCVGTASLRGSLASLGIPSICNLNTTFWFAALYLGHISHDTAWCQISVGYIPPLILIILWESCQLLLCVCEKDCIHINRARVALCSTCVCLTWSLPHWWLFWSWTSQQGPSDLTGCGHTTLSPGHDCKLVSDLQVWAHLGPATHSWAFKRRI